METKADSEQYAIGTSFADDTGSVYRVLWRYELDHKLGSGAPNHGYVAEALRGSLVSRGAIYLVPYCRVLRAEVRREGNPAPLHPRPWSFGPYPPRVIR